jgi:hypothetical protein
LGATGNFIDTKLVEAFKLWNKQEPYQLFVVDRTTIGLEKGIVTQETDSLVLEQIGGHSEDIHLDIVTLGRHQVILGMPWLYKHNPQIDWKDRQVTINQCQCKSNSITLQRAKLPLNRGELRITHLSKEDQAQASVLKKIPAAYKEYIALFQEGPLSEALPKY